MVSIAHSIVGLEGASDERKWPICLCCFLLTIYLSAKHFYFFDSPAILPSHYDSFRFPVCEPVALSYKYCTAISHTKYDYTIRSTAFLSFSFTEYNCGVYCPSILIADHFHNIGNFNFYFQSIATNTDRGSNCAVYNGSIRDADRNTKSERETNS